MGSVDMAMLPDIAALAELAKFDLNLPRKRPLL